LSEAFLADHRHWLLAGWRHRTDGGFGQMPAEASAFVGAAWIEPVATAGELALC
jgi:hypothetical protein